MDHDLFLTRVIDEGTAAARESYSEPPNADKLAGAIAGFEACRGKDAQGLRNLLRMAAGTKEKAFREQADDYWWFACYYAEVEWVCNVVSAALMNQGQPVIITPTARGYLKAASILGVASAEDLR